MSKKIVIDIEEKELIIRNIEYALEGGLNPANRLLKIIDLLQGKTEIDTDQSIDVLCQKIFDKHIGLNQENGYIPIDPSDIIDALKDCATEQDLISKAREKEKKCDLCEGYGYTVGSDIGCCQFPNDDGTCCGNGVQIPIQLPCEKCQTKGTI